MAIAATGLRTVGGPPWSTHVPVREPTAIRNIVLALTAVTIASGAVVFSEPAPVDVMMMGLIFALPVAGLVSFKPLLVVVFAVWLTIGSLTLLAGMSATDFARSTTHTAISVYLYFSFLVIAALIARHPARHLPLIMNAYVVAALIAGIAGIVGYFDVLPGAAELFTKFGRASGTFKDPNVYGPFLILPLIYVLHLMVTRPFVGTFLPAAVFCILLLAVLVSFSRGAWINLAIALSVYAFLTFTTAPRWRSRIKLIFLALLGIGTMAALLAHTLSIPEFADLMHQRAQLFQNYDVGPEGRFGGQLKAIDIILQRPFGIGSLEFADIIHHEAAHNIYLTVAVRGGWIAGLLFIGIVLATLAVGFAHALKRRPSQRVFIVAYAAFVALVIQGFLVDTDHWRHLYLIMAVIWGLIVSEDAARNDTLAISNAPPRRSPRMLRRLRGISARTERRIQFGNPPPPTRAARIVTTTPHSRKRVRQPRIVARTTDSIPKFVTVSLDRRLAAALAASRAFSDIIENPAAGRRLQTHRPRRPQFIAYTEALAGQ